MNLENELTDEEVEAFRMSKFDELILNSRREILGKIELRHGDMTWTSAKDNMQYTMPFPAFEKIMQENATGIKPRKMDMGWFTREYVPIRHYRDHDAECLTPEQREQLKQLNEKLTRIEHEAAKESRPLLENLQQRLNNPDDWLQDYECDLVVTFWVGEDDPDYDDDEDNIIAVIEDLADGDLLADGENHSHFMFDAEHPMNDEFHCWLYHCLYDHTNLGWKDLLRIRNIWVDIKVQLQRWEWEGDYPNCFTQPILKEDL